MLWTDVERFLDDWGSGSRSPQVVERYRYCLERFYRSMPGDHLIRQGTVRQWREQLLENGYAPNTANMYVSACNTWLEYMGRREYQLLGQLDVAGRYRTALKREEYLRLLVTARSLGWKRIFLIVKVFGNTGLYARELSEVTVKKVRSGWLSGRENGKGRKVRLPDGLREELIAYIEEENIVSGPVFRTRSGSVLGRTTVATLIRRLGKEAGLADGKATPSGLRLMYVENRSEIEADAALLVEQSLERQAAQEQLIVGWKV